jgi:sugar fermentation stimulation protein A
MRLPPLSRARFVSRPNRFVVWAELDGQPLYCHMPNPGRMHELLFPGVPLWVTPRSGPGVTTHQVVLAQHEASLVCLDSRLPPGLFVEALRAGLIPELGACPRVRTEVTWGASRLDLALSCATGEWLVETKSCTLVVDAVARFPDAPTVRGARHLHELMGVAAQGLRPAVAFMIQRDDPARFAPNDATDPAFGRVLRQAALAGVLVVAVLCRVTTAAVTPLRRIPVDLT